MGGNGRLVAARAEAKVASVKVTIAIMREDAEGEGAPTRYERVPMTEEGASAAGPSSSSPSSSSHERMPSPRRWRSQSVGSFSAAVQAMEVDAGVAGSAMQLGMLHSRLRSSNDNLRLLAAGRPRPRGGAGGSIMSSLLGFLRRGGKKSSGGVRRRGSGILTRNRSHVLNIKNLSPGGSTGSAPELLWQEKEKEEKMMSECRMVRANKLVLLMAAVALAWTLILLLTSPIPLLDSVPQHIVDVNVRLHEGYENNLRVERELSSRVVPIALPWSNVTRPLVNSFSQVMSAKDVCEAAAKAEAGATGFERTFGAHDFHHVTDMYDDKRRRIALFTGAYSNIRDGVSLTLNKMVAFLEANGHEFEVFAPTADRPALEAVGKVLSVPSVPVPGRPEYRLSLILSPYLKKELREFAPDIVHIATPDIVGFQALLWAKMNHVPTACSYHTRFNSYLEYYNVGFLEGSSWLIWREFYGNCDHVYVPSKEIKQELQEHGIKNEIKIWARGVDGDVFNPKFRCPAWRREIGVGEGEVVVLLVCRMVWEKNLELFAKTVEALQARGMRFKSVVVGEGPARAELERRLPNTAFLGNLKGVDLSVAYANADIFLFPSTTETFGSTTLEAMASGLPVVVSNSSGSNSIVKHDQNGFIADPKDVEAFATYTGRLISDAPLRRRMAREGMRIAEEDFQYPKIFGDLAGFYTDLIVGDRISGELHDDWRG